MLLPVALFLERPGLFPVGEQARVIWLLACLLLFFLLSLTLGNAGLLGVSQIQQGLSQNRLLPLLSLHLQRPSCYSSHLLLLILPLPFKYHLLHEAFLSTVAASVSYLNILFISFRGLIRVCNCLLCCYSLVSSIKLQAPPEQTWTLSLFFFPGLLSQIPCPTGLSSEWGTSMEGL